MTCLPSDDPGRPRPHIRWVFGAWTRYPRYDKRDYVYRGTIDVASIRIWLRDPVDDPSDRL
jgi:hypothetical protein